MTLLVDDVLDDGTTGTAFVARGSLAVAGAAPTWVDAGFRGGRALGVSTTATSGVIITTTSSNAKYADVLFKLGSTVTANDHVLTCRGTADVARVVFTSGNRMRLTDGAGATLQTGTVALPVGAWFRVALQVVGSTATASLFTNPDSTTPAETLTGTVVGANMTECRAGNLGNVALGSSSFALDWPQVANDTAPGVRGATATTVAVTLNPTSGIFPGGATTTATATVTNSPAGTKTWTFVWGDGTTSTSSSQTSTATASHTYGSEGNFSVVATLDVT